MGVLRRGRSLRWFVIALAGVMAGGCDDAEPFEADGGSEPAAAEVSAAPEETSLAELRALTEPFRDFARAEEAGYGVEITPCWYHRELGGQGYHFGKPELIDGTVALLEPELLMYEPLPDGELDLVAIEYIVPIDQWEGSNPPELLGRHFHRNEGLGLFVLHVWLWRENPSGLYSDWNPNVSCEHADEAEDRA